MHSSHMWLVAAIWTAQMQSIPLSQKVLLDIVSCYSSYCYCRRVSARGGGRYRAPFSTPARYLPPSRQPRQRPVAACASLLGCLHPPPSPGDIPLLSRLGHRASRCFRMGQPAIERSPPPRVSALFEGRDWVLFIFTSPVPGIGQMTPSKCLGERRSCA